MQVRYQLRHSPNCFPGSRRSNAGILTTRPDGCEIGVRVRRRRRGCRPASRNGAPGARRSQLDPAAVVQAVQRGALARPASRAARARRRGSRRRARPRRRTPPGRQPASSSSRAAAIRAETCAAFSPPGTTSKSPGAVLRELLGEALGVLREGQALALGRGSTPAAARRTSARGRSPWRRTPRSPARGRCRRTTGPPVRGAASTAAAAAAWSCPVSSSSDSSWPWTRPAAFHDVRPWRSSTRRADPALAGASALMRDDVGRQLDRRAVAPQPLERVEGRSSSCWTCTTTSP